jgi:F0F1-type ATP synthase assembly protein I
MSDLDKDIKAFEKKRAEEAAPKKSDAGGMASAGRAGYEIIVSVVFFSVIGYALDYQLDTLPWITLVLFFLGFATGIYNAWRSLNAKGDRVGLTRVATPPKKP